MEGALDDFGIADRALLDPRLLAELVDDLGDAGALRRVALVVIVVKTRLLLLAPAAFGGERVADALDPVRVAVPADVDAGQVALLQRPHRAAEIDIHLVDLPRGRAFQSPLLRPALARRAPTVRKTTVAPPRPPPHLAP